MSARVVGEYDIAYLMDTIRCLFADGTQFAVAVSIDVMLVWLMVYSLISLI